jgi:hypothetical protein
MFTSFADRQILEPGWSPLFKAAQLQLQFLGRGEELQLTRQGERLLSVSLNSLPFVCSAPSNGDYEVHIGFGRVTKPQQTLRASLGGKFDPLSADEDVNHLTLPAVQVPTMLIFVEKPFSSERQIFGFQFMGQLPMRELPVEMDDPSRIDKGAFRALCERALGVPKEF